MTQDSELTFGDPPLSATTGGNEGGAGQARLRELVEGQHDFVWRSVRRLGVPRCDVEDAVQKVFLVAASKLASIRYGSERSFLFQTALRVASDSRRTQRRRREVMEMDGDEEPASQALSSEELLDLRRAREQLDRILDEMPLDLRAVFVLFELEEMTMAEIAKVLGLPPGTVASRLRRARATFQERVNETHASSSGGTTP
jgi:RNA polymerase sigma-70 factor (ECF subfamily)